MAKAKYPPAGPLGQTDPSRWRLDSADNGRHVWHYVRDADSAGYEALWGEDERHVRKESQSEESKYWLGLPLDMPSKVIEPNGHPYLAAQKAFDFYKRLQAKDGHWSGEYGGPLFLTPGLVITLYVTKTPIPPEWKIECARYLANIQRRGGPGDEGWGIHFEGKSTVFGTGLNYVTLRLLGVDAEEPMMQRARATLHKLGGCNGLPSWGKFWLSVLNCHSWSGVNPTPAELWLLPTFLPFHPHRWWIHTRNVYIPMSVLQGHGFQAPVDDLILSLRQELYVEPYDKIDWPSVRNNCSSADLYSPHSSVADALFGVLNVWNGVAPSIIRRKALERAYRLVVMEDENTAYQTIGPVSKSMNMLCRWLIDGPDSEAFKLHVEKCRDFMWMTKDGMTMTGTNGSQLWDTAFITQALTETGLINEGDNRQSMKKALEWLDETQIREDPKWYKEAFRHSTKGAWPFSTKEQGYAVSDCASEGLKSVILLQEAPGMPELVDERRMCDTIDLILGMQNADGGFASYELIRGPALLELLNPAEVFGNIMIEYSYPECTTSCVTALMMFKKKYPDYRAADIERVVKRAVKYIHDKQRPDGSWYGSWGVCFTYAAMFALESLMLAGETYENSESVRRACEFLLSKQMDDGGWGESYKSCETMQYVHNAKSQIVNTSFVIISLLTARYPDPEPIKRGCRLIMSRQNRDGSFPQESIEGIFNKNAAISYPNFKHSFSIKALGLAAKHLPKDMWKES